MQRTFVQLLLIVGTKLEHIITCLAQEAAKLRDGQEAPRVKPSDHHFWFRRPCIVLYLIHFILFQNSFEFAFFIWLWVRKLRKQIFSFEKWPFAYKMIFGILRAPMVSTPAQWKRLVTSSPDLLLGNGLFAFRRIQCFIRINCSSLFSF